MGGIQFIALGDFYQLPPVPNPCTQDPGHYCFQSVIWDTLAPHKVILGEVHRQDDTQFINVINETARGCPSAETTSFLQALNNNIPRSTKLYCKKADVFIANHEQLAYLPGESTVYSSTEGVNISKRLRKCVDAPVKLFLKMGAPVILTVNLSSHLVNGLGGYVHALGEDTVDVYFTDLNEVHAIKRHNYFVYDRRHDKNIFVCSQIPLLLSYALTIHKSQGMTLDSVFVDCTGAFDAGQLSVAFGRVHKPSQLTVRNFRPELCPPHPQQINAYYGKESSPVLEDLACCNQFCEMPNIAECDPPSLSIACDSEDSGSDAEENGVVVMNDVTLPHAHNDFSYPSSFNTEDIRHKMLFKNTYTPMMRDHNTLITEVEDSEWDDWIKYLYRSIFNIGQQKRMRSGSSRHSNAVVHEFITQYSKSQEFKGRLSQCFNSPSISETLLSIGIKALITVSDAYFQSHAPQEGPTPTPQVPSQHSNIAKVRYVAGMCVGKVLHRLKEYICSHILDETTILTQKKIAYRTLQKHLLPSITIANLVTSFPESLSEITFRQTQYGHLTIVDDELLEMFKQFDDLIYPTLTSHCVHKERDTLFSNILDAALDSLYTDMGQNHGELTLEIVRPAFVIYLNVSLKELGGRIQIEKNVGKKLSHRKQVMLDEKGGPSRKRPKACTSNSMASSTATQDPSTSAGTTSTIYDKCNSPSNNNSPQPSTSVEDSSRNDQTTAIDDTSVRCECIVCNNLYVDPPSVEWMECSVCNGWIEKTCDRLLNNPNMWKHYCKEDEEYKCPKCRPVRYYAHTMHGAPYVKSIPLKWCVRCYQALFTNKYVGLLKKRGICEGCCKGRGARDEVRSVLLDKCMYFVHNTGVFLSAH